MNLNMELKKFFYKLSFYGSCFGSVILAGCSTTFNENKGPNPNDTIIKVSENQVNESLPDYASRTAVSHRPRYTPSRPVGSIIARGIDHIEMEPIDIQEDVIVIKDEKPKIGTNYVVKKGDTIWRLSRRFGLKVSDILTANKLDKNDKIIAGQKIFLPNVSEAEVKNAISGSKYTIQSGDTLSRIASKFHTTINDIKLANNMSNDKIVAGKILTVPNGKPNSNVSSSGSGKSSRASTIYAGDYTIQRGDTLASIAKRSGISVADLQQVNHLGDPSKLQVGKKLTIAKATKDHISTVSVPQASGIEKIASSQGDRSSTKLNISNYDFMNDSDFFQGIDNIPIVQVSE
ncbi:MAG: LysM peptidoglycan-binding domain-containing protein [Puniceicoccales bacterium]|nr:LysM peptidoglycan-binding domain-containing protein [Puniceicoccales bacterium]